jgi:hypothetical protein
VEISIAKHCQAKPQAPLFCPSSMARLVYVMYMCCALSPKCDVFQSHSFGCYLRVLFHSLKDTHCPVFTSNELEEQTRYTISVIQAQSVQWVSKQAVAPKKKLKAPLALNQAPLNDDRFKIEA